MGNKDHIIDFFLNMIMHPDKQSVSCDEMIEFCEKVYKNAGADEAWKTEEEALREHITESFGRGDVDSNQFRLILEQWDVFSTWNTLILPLLESKKWKRSNPALAP
eukprot:NODE_3560_length_391_cov_509.508772_g3008_i0.p1 GENE.NODE_3560_length_391_cov_509.508772_g3008_i0~~NODE_3560_length_391_cov_509.508772_g3008_i0.p1  ORF type:complete len:106 (+),score=13.52 NODE_3560_length_391_cov_509.508772_g3008_i0:28-345(+)